MCAQGHSPSAFYGLISEVIHHQFCHSLLRSESLRTARISGKRDQVKLCALSTWHRRNPSLIVCRKSGCTSMGELLAISVPPFLPAPPTQCSERGQDLVEGCFLIPRQGGGGAAFPDVFPGGWCPSTAAS